MSIKHENADHGAEADTFREALAQYETKITKDEVVKNENGEFTLIQYVVGEGDPPFVEYRFTLEAVRVLSLTEYDELVALKTAEHEQA